MLLTYLLINGFFGFVGCRRLYTRAAVPSDVWGRELSGRAADSARWLRLKLLKWKVHCSNPLVTGSNPVGGANFEKPSIWLGPPERRETWVCPCSGVLKSSLRGYSISNC